MDDDTVKIARIIGTLNVAPQCNFLRALSVNMRPRPISSWF